MRLLHSLVLIALGLAVVVPAVAESLADQVTIRRTEYGIPHILAETEKAAAYGFAWAQSEDHFPLVYKAMVRGRAEIAQHYGGSTDDDFQVRLFRARERAIESYHLLSADMRDMMAGYAAGVNAYMAAHPEEVADWMTPVTAHDVAATGLVSVMRFTFNRGGIIRHFKRAAAKMAQADTGVETEDMGSNTIALAPSRTKSGHAMLLNNPHQPWSEQAHYYEAHLTVPGKYNFYGSTFVGGPLLTTGFNEALGWAHTVNYPDLEEIYALALDPENPGHYLFDGGSVAIETEEVTVIDEAGTPVTQTLAWTPLGPVILMTADTAYVLKSVGYTQYLAGEQWYRMGQAKSLEEFREVLAMQEIAMFNIGYADRDGNIMYLWNGTIPDIPHQNSLATPVPADDSGDVWTRIHPMADLMQLVNPEGGYIQNCNAPPYFTNLRAPMKRSDYPAHYPANALWPRTQHALMLVDNDQKFSLEEFADLKFSMRLVMAERLRDELVALLEAADLDAPTREAIAVLKAWDTTAAAESVGSVLFVEWWDRYLSDPAKDFVVQWSEAEPMDTPRGIADGERAVAEFVTAAASVVKRWGAVDVPWGEVHRLRRGNLDVPVGGGDRKPGAFRVLKFAKQDDGKRAVNSGDSYIFVVEFGDTPRAYSVLGYSQSGREDSPHYTDQSALFAANKMKPVAFTEDEIKKQLLREYRPGE